jgi:uncharacterized protein with PQ loop repeat
MGLNMEYVFISVIFVLLFILDFIKVYKSKNKKNIFIYLILFTFSLLIIILHEKNVKIISVNAPIEFFFKNIIKLS